MPLFTLPYVVFGNATDANGSAITNTALIVTNETSGETITVFTDSSGDYIFDLANFASGYADGDSIRISTSDDTDVEIYASHNAGVSWNQVQDGVKSVLEVNGLTVQIDETNYPGGREVTVIHPI